MRIDHVILATRDVEAASRRLLVDHGLGSVVGGDHPAWGTGNRIVPAGSSYLEVMGIRDEPVARTTDLGRYVLDRAANGDRLALVCLTAADLDAACARLGIVAEERSRTRPDGTVITWRMAGLESALAEGTPFFIDWDDATGADVPDPDAGERANAVLRVALGGEADLIRAWVGEDVPGLDLVGGEPGVASVTVRVGDREVVLGGA